MESCHVALDKELQAIINQAPEGEEAKNGERLIQFASENLVTEVLINPQLNTLIQCVRNLLSSFTKHRHIIHAGYTFAGNGSWIVQDGTFSLADLIDAFQETEVQRVLRAYELSVTVDIHCAPEGEWSTARLRRESFGKLCRVRVNPDDSPCPAENIGQFVDYLAPFITPASIDQLLEPSDVVGNIRFSHPTLYVFPGGQGDAALFGINGFNMLVDGGFSRKACFWDFARHLDRLDAVLVTRINNSNVNGIASVLRRKTSSQVYPQIGHFFCNLQDRKQPCTPDEEKVRDSLLVSLLDEGQEMVQNLRLLQMKPHICVRDSVLEPINLYHKVGHGKLDMYVISPAKDSKELKEFLSKWHSHDISLFSSSSKKPGDKDISFPLQNLVSICALLVWQPANPEDTITRILFPGSTPQQKIFEGLEKLRCLEFMKQPVCTAKSLSPSSSTVGISSKMSRVKSSPAVIDKLLPGEGLSKPVSKTTHQTDAIAKQNVAKTATIPVAGAGEFKPKLTAASKPAKPKIEKSKPDNKTDTDKNIEIESELISKQDRSIIISDQSKDNESSKIKTEKQKPESKPKKLDAKVPSKLSEKKTKSSSIEKKDSVKSSPTTPKKSLDTKVNGVASKTDIIKSTSKVSNKTKTSPSATPAKSTKEENNRKVVESKVRAAAAAKTNSGKLPKREESLPRQKNDKRISKKTSSSPVRVTSKPLSPVKGTMKTASKPKKERAKSKPEIEKGIVTDSSTVSTPSTVDAEKGITKGIKVDKKEKQLENAQNDLLDKPKDNEKADAAELDNLNGSNIINEPDTAGKLDTRHLDTSDRDLSEKEEDDEILIIEKVELEQYGDDSTQDQESFESHIPDETEDEIQKHLRDEAESEKKKEDESRVDGNKVQGKETAVCESVEKNELTATASNVDSVPVKLDISIDHNTLADTVLSPENREQIEEEVQEIITSATDFVTKTKLEQSKESSELSAEGVGSDEQKTSAETKDPSSADKLNIVSDKNFTDDDNKHDDTKDKSREVGEARFGAEESQPDEKFSTTVESGATTAPTLPEDERIPLDEIKEGVEEKYDKEDTKEKDTGAVQGRIEQPTTLPQVSIVSGGKFETQASQVMVRDIVKTPDEVADLPVHEEVDGLYEDENFIREGQKSKEDLLNIGSSKKDTDGNLKQLTKPDTSVLVSNGKSNNTDKDIENQALAVGDIETADKETDGTLLIEKVLAGEDLVHATLKAPEVAELVLVTPDSAPDSPLHNLGMNTYGVEKNTENEQNTFEEIPRAHKDILHADIEDRELKPEGKLEGDGKIIVGENETKEAAEPDNNVPCDTTDDIEKNNTVKLPQTPPASPVLFAMEKDPVKDKININKDKITENGGLKDHDVSITRLDGKHEDELQDLHRKTEESTISRGKEEPNQSLKVTEVEDEPGETLDDIRSLEGTKPKAPKQESPKSISPVPSEREDESQEYKDPKPLEDKLEKPESISPMPSDNIDEILPQKGTNVITDKQDTPKCISPVLSVTKDESDAISEAQSLVKKHDTPESFSPVPSESIDISQIVKDEKVVTEKQDTPKNISTILSEREPEAITLKATQSSEEKQDTPKSVSPVPSENIDVSKAIKDAKVVTEKQDTPKSISPIPSEREPQGMAFDETETLEMKHDSSKGISPVPNENINISQVIKDANVVPETQDTSKSISPILSEKEPEGIAFKETKSLEEKHDHPKSISLVPSETVDESQVITDDIVVTEKQDTPKSISPVPSENIRQVIQGAKVDTEKQEAPKKISPILGISGREPTCIDLKETKSSEEKQDTPKSISPVPSEIIDISQVIKDAKVVTEKQDIPKSISPIPREREPEGIAFKETKSLEEKHDHPKSISLVPSETVDESQVITDDIVVTEKQDTPKSISPILSKREPEGIAFKETKSSEEKHDAPNGISLVTSEQIDTSQAIKDAKKVMEKQDKPKSISPIPSEKEREDIDITTEKQDSPKGLSPEPSVRKVDSQTANETKPLEDKSGSPISISPLHSENIDESHLIKDTKEGIEKQDIPKSINQLLSETADEIRMQTDTKVITDTDRILTSRSPVPSETEDRSKDFKDTKLLDEKHDSHESIEKGDDIPVLVDTKLIMEKHDKTHIVSPVPSENIDECQVSRESTSVDTHDTPKTISPVPNEKGNASPALKDNDSITEEQYSPKSFSPAHSERGGEIQASKESILLEEKHDLPKSISPVPSEKDNGSPALELEEKHDTPKSISPVPGEKDVASPALKLEEKHETPKSISPVPSEKDDGSPAQKLEEKHETPKSASPVPCEKDDGGPALKLEEKHDTPNSMSPIPSEKGDDSPDQKLKEKHETPKSISPVPGEKDVASPALKLEEKHETPKSISPVPSEKDDGSPAQKLEEKHETPKSASPVPSEKDDGGPALKLEEKHDTPKSISPVPSEKGDDSPDQKLKEKHETPKSISPVPSEKDDGSPAQKLEEKHETPKSISPVPSEKDDGSPAQKLDEKHDTLKSISPVPSEKSDGSPALKLEEKHDTPKSISPVPSDKDDGSSALQLEEKHEAPKSISPVPSEKDDGSPALKLEEKRETPKSISPVPSDKDDGSPALKLEEKHETPKSISPVPSEKDDGSPALKLEKRETPKSISPVPSEKDDGSPALKLEEKRDTPKSISPVPSEKADDSPALKLKEKYDTPKSISPVPSEKDDGSPAFKLEEKHDTPKSISPVPSEKDDGSPAFKLEEKHDTLKSISPVPSEKDDGSPAFKLEEKHDTPKSISPVPSEKADGSPALKLEEKHDTPISPVPSKKIDGSPALKLEEKHDTPKSISPVPSEKVDGSPALKLEEKHDTPKSISPVPSEKDDGSPALKYNDSVTENKDSPKSISLSPCERGGDDRHASKESSLLEEKHPVSSKQDEHNLPQSSSLVLSNRIDEKQASNETKLFEEKCDSSISIVPLDEKGSDGPTHKDTAEITTKQDTTKNISPLSSEMGDKRETKSLEDKHDTNKSVTPVPGEKVYDSFPQKDMAIKETYDTCERSGEVKAGKEAKSLDEQLDSCKSVSPVLDDQADENKLKSTIYTEEKQNTPQCLSQKPNEQADQNHIVEKYDTPGVASRTVGGSPAPSTIGDARSGLSSTLDQNILNEESKVLEEDQKDHIDDHIPKSISTVSSDAAYGNKVPKQYELLEGKHDTSKSVISEDNERENRMSYDETSLEERHVTLESECLVKNGKEDQLHNLKGSEPLEESCDSPSISHQVADVLIDNNTSKPTTPSEETQHVLQNVCKLPTEQIHEPPSDSQSLKVIVDPQMNASSDGQLESPSGKKDSEEQENRFGQPISIVPMGKDHSDRTEGITTEKSETELPEKCKFELSKESTKSSKQETDEVDDCVCKFDSPAQKLHQGGINESDNKSIEDSFRNALTSEKVPVLTSSIMESNGDLENNYVSQEKSGHESKELTDSFKTATESSHTSQETPILARKLSTTSEVNDTELVTNAVIENTLESKDIKTAEILNIESSSVVPSSTFVINSKDSELSIATSQLSCDERDDRSSSVHRMLVTGSSEDGGTETELCSSSVTHIVGDSYDKQMGNVSHDIGEESGKNKNSDEISTMKLASCCEDLSSTEAPNILKPTEIDSKSTKRDSEQSVEKPSPINVFTPDDVGLKQSVDHVAKLQQESSKIQTVKPTETVFSGTSSSQLKREITDSVRSGTPASDLTSDREIDTGGPSTPHSDISSGQVSRVATHTWESEGRHADSDDDLPCSPMSAASHAAQSPPQFDFDVNQHAKEGFYQEASKPKDLPLAMTSSLYGNLPEEDPLEEFSKHLPTSGGSQMYSSMYVSKYGDDDHEESPKLYSTDSKGQFEALFSSKKDDIDFETAVKEHISTRGEDLTTQLANGNKDIAVNEKQPPGANGSGKQPYVNGKGSQPESLEYQDITQSVSASTSCASQKPVDSKPVPTEPSRGVKPSADDKKDPIEGWGKPLGLPPPPKSLIESPLSRSTLTLVWNPADEWGIPLGLPSPAPPTAKKDSINGEFDSEITPSSNKTTPKKVARRNAENKSASNTQVGKEASYKTKHPESPVKRGSNKESRGKPVSPVYVDLTYVPHHGNSYYTNVEFFKRVRARYYVFSGTEPSREVFNALLEAKQTWEDKELEVTIIPTYDTDTLGYWVAENEDVLAKHKIDLSPSASRCTINLQDHETSCSAYRLEF